jgi:alginate O-acetyltransferase complex protein AlgI
VYLLVLTSSILFNFSIGSLIQKYRMRIILYFGILIDLTVLGFFKYLNFLFENLTLLINQMNQNIIFPFGHQDIVLPLGISFFTFTQIAFLVDTYKEKTNAPNLLDYSLFVSIYPHLIAGPILSHKKIIPQFAEFKTYIINNENVAIGITLFVIGLFKKVIIADTLATWVTPVFDNALSASMLEAWVGALSYTMQLYFDFSGYADMAIGLALLFNITFPLCFDSPYKSKSIIEFWRRWNITLSNFLRDYLYIPLGGNREGKFNQIRNIMITMLLGGLWHGAGWTFIIWGGLHGMFLSINHGFRDLKIKVPTLLSWSVTFLCVIIAWVFFRSKNLNDALLLLKSMFGFRTIIIPSSWQPIFPFAQTLGLQFGSVNLLIAGAAFQLLGLFFLIFVVCLLPNSYEIATKHFKPNLKWTILIGGLFCLCLWFINNPTEFLYYQF